MKLSQTGMNTVKLNNIDEMYPGQSILLKTGQLVQYGAGLFGYNTVPLLVRRNIEKIFVETLLMNLGAGTMTAKEINVYEKATINGGAGNINIYSGTINNLNLKLGAGNASIESDLTGSNTLTTGVGKLNLGLSRSKDNYKFDISKGLGNIILNDFDVSEDILIGDGETKIKISGAVGNIIINTAE